MRYPEKMKKKRGDTYYTDYATGYNKCIEDTRKLNEEEANGYDLDGNPIKYGYFDGSEAQPVKVLSVAEIKKIILDTKKNCESIIVAANPMCTEDYLIAEAIHKAVKRE